MLHVSNSPSQLTKKVNSKLNREFKYVPDFMMEDGCVACREKPDKYDWWLCSIHTPPNIFIESTLMIYYDCSTDTMKSSSIVEERRN